MRNFSPKPWQWIAFISYLLVLNIVVFGTVIYLFQANDLLTGLGTLLEGPAQAAAPITPTATRRPTFTPTPPAETTPTATPAWVALAPPAAKAPVPSATATASPTASPSPSATPTTAPTATPSPTATATPAPSRTPTARPTATPSATPSPTTTATGTATPTSSPTPTASPSATATATATPSPTASPTLPATPTATPTPVSTPVAVAVAAIPPAPAREETVAVTSLRVDRADRRVDLSWEAVPGAERYRLYSDMGTGYGVYIYKTDLRQPAVSDTGLRPGWSYSYRLTGLLAAPATQAEQTLAHVTVETAAGELPAAAGVLASAAGTAAGQPAPAVTPAPTSLPPDAILLGLLSDHSFQDELGNLFIVGEVRNDSNVDAGQTSVAVTFYDDRGAVIGQAEGSTLLSTLAPGRRSPFLLNLSWPEGMADYSLRAVGRPAAPQAESGLVVISSAAGEDETGLYHVSGVVENQGSAAVAQSRVVVTLYGRGGDVINVGFGRTTPPRLAPGQQATFDLTFAYFPKVLSHAVIAGQD